MINNKLKALSVGCWLPSGITIGIIALAVTRECQRYQGREGKALQVHLETLRDTQRKGIDFSPSQIETILIETGSGNQHASVEIGSRYPLFF